MASLARPSGGQTPPRLNLGPLLGVQIDRGQIDPHTNTPDSTVRDEAGGGASGCVSGCTPEFLNSEAGGRDFVNEPAMNSKFFLMNTSYMR
jgi:hypothetical protein